MKKQFNHIFSALIISTMILLAFGSDEESSSSESQAKSNSPDYWYGKYLKTQNDINKHALVWAEHYCKQWSEATSRNNETSRANGQSIVLEQALHYGLTDLRNTIQVNDLPDSYYNPAYKIFEDKLKECGVEGY